MWLKEHHDITMHFGHAVNHVKSGALADLCPAGGGSTDFDPLSWLRRTYLLSIQTMWLTVFVNLGVLIQDVQGKFFLAWL